MHPRSQKAAEFASQFLYGICYDHAVKQAVRHQQTLEEVLERADIEKAWSPILDDGSAKPALGEEAADSAALAGPALISMLPTESLAKLNQPENASKLEVVQGAVDAARKQTKSQVQTADSSQSLEKLSKLIRAMTVTKLRGGPESSVLILYQLEAAGEHERDARRSPTPVRRDHQEKVLKAIWSTRSPDLPDFDDEKLIYPALDASDVCHGDFAFGYQVK